MQWIGKFFSSTAGKAVGGLLALIVVLFLARTVRDYFSPPVVAAMRQSVFLCTATGKTFTHEPMAGETVPILSPYSGEKTGYPAEYCYWNKDGTTKTDPTPVILNAFLNKPGPTFCPDCGRLVVFHNPAPVPGMKPPPTREEYERMHAASGQ